MLKTWGHFIHAQSGPIFHTHLNSRYTRILWNNCGIPTLLFRMSDSSHCQISQSVDLVAQCLKRSNGTVFRKRIKEENIKLLIEEKCDLFEILEWPQIVSVESEEIKGRISYLKDMNLPVSVGHLKCVQETTNQNLFPQLLKKYHKSTQGFKSIGACLAECYGVNKGEMLTILSKPRIPLSKIIRKIDIMMKYGYEAVEVLSDTSIMAVSEKELRSRCEYLTQLGITPPPRKFLVMTRAVFKARFSTSVREQSQKESFRPTSTEPVYENTPMGIKVAEVSGNEVFKILKDYNCEDYEFLEWPEIFRSNTEQLRKWIKLLEAQKFPVSVGHIKCASGTNAKNRAFSSLHDSIELYHKNTQGHKSIGDCMVNDHGISVEKATQLIGEYPNVPWPKFFLLLGHGTSEDDILDNSQYFSRISEKELRRRCRYLITNGWISFSTSDLMLGKSKANFHSAVKTKASRICKAVARLLNTTVGHLTKNAGKLPSHSLESASYLVNERNYSSEEVLRNNEIIKTNVNELKQALEALNSMLSNQPVSIESILTYITLSSGKDRIPVTTGLTYAISLLSTTENMNSFVKESVPKVSNVSIKDIKLNYHFLLNECKLSQADVGLLPVLLLHRPAALRKHWKSLVEETDPTLFSQLRNQPVKLLHLLQYNLEKSTNFRHIYVLDDQMSSDEQNAKINSSSVKSEQNSERKK